MPTLTEAEAALEAAHRRLSLASLALQEARAKANTVRQQPDRVTPADIATADDAVTHAELILDAANAAVPPLSAAVQAARADELCDEIVGQLAALGSDVRQALDALASTLAPLTSAVLAYDKFTEASVIQLGRVGTVSPRVKIGRHTTPQVDRLQVASCRGAGQVARLLKPVMERVGAPRQVIENLALLAAGAPNLPGTES